ncbi:MAG: FMN-binding negative transcriptional regulator [Rhizobiales bacterium]|nr:FMN-binding negative transcriptional regulator [Hyphomicrobiales bacterium]MBI3674569.1 FMN-binding negative transcriptional regulator [Hyphomicrobiales bacterium]
MYLPTHFREDRLEVQHDLIRTHPLGLLISDGASGLQASPLPFLIDARASKLGTLRAHLARANGHWQELAESGECLVVFQGPQAYVTPSWYETKRETGKVVPTWNYVTVHAWGRARAIEDGAWLRQQIGELTAKQESPRATPWKVEDAPADFLAAQIRAIVGLEIPIDRIEGKWKASQNRPAKDRAGVVAGLSEMGEMDRAMARLVEERCR